MVFRKLDREIRTGFQVRSLGELPSSRAPLLDISPKQFLRIAADQLPPGYRQRLARYRHGPGEFKVG